MRMWHDNTKLENYNNSIIERLHSYSTSYLHSNLKSPTIRRQCVHNMVIRKDQKAFSSSLIFNQIKDVKKFVRNYDENVKERKPLGSE